MHEYEVLIETINPCGGEAHANKEFREIETDSPEAYVREQGLLPGGRRRRASRPRGRGSRNAPR